jgi:hypothetical protein
MTDEDSPDLQKPETWPESWRARAPRRTGAPKETGAIAVPVGRLLDVVNERCFPETDEDEDNLRHLQNARRLRAWVKANEPDKPARGPSNDYAVIAHDVDVWISRHVKHGSTLSASGYTWPLLKRQLKLPLTVEHLRRLAQDPSNPIEKPQVVASRHIEQNIR